jgi:hypothetical protein
MHFYLAVVSRFLEPSPFVAPASTRRAPLSLAASLLKRR